MRAIIQRVLRASVSIDEKVYSKINAGMMILLGIDSEDTEEDLEWLAGKIANIRIFDDEKGVMNRNISQVMGEIMLISQFTLLASTKKGNRPSYIRAAKPPKAIPMYEKMRDILTELTGQEVKTGAFGEEMSVNLLNHGPVTIFIDSKNKE